MRVKAMALSITTGIPVLYVLSFFIPFLIQGPQLLVGIAVNTLLFLSIQKLSVKQLIPIIMLPSIAALLNGIVFGPATPFLYYLMPFIWIGNTVLIYSAKFLTHKAHPIITVPISALLKSSFLFAVAYILHQNAIIPSVFVTAMGIVQFITACIGGYIAYLIFYSGALSYE